MKKLTYKQALLIYIISVGLLLIACAISVFVEKNFKPIFMSTLLILLGSIGLRTIKDKERQ